MRAGVAEGLRERCRELERQLAESQRRLEESQQLAKVGSWEWDLHELRSSWSKEMLRIFGRDPDGPQPTLDELIAAVHSSDRADFEMFVARVRTKPGSFRHGYRIVNGDGDVRHLQAFGKTVLDSNGTPLRAFGTTQDVTELKRSEQDLKSRVEQQAGVAALGRFALSAPTVDELMNEATRMVSSVLCVDLVEVMELDERGDACRIKAGTGWGSGVVGRAVSRDQVPAVHSLREGVVLIEDYESESPLVPAEHLRDHGARSGVAAAIECADRAYGAIGAYSTEARRFSSDDAHFLQAVGNVLGAAIERERARRVEAQLEQAQRLESVGQLAAGVAHDFNNLLLVILSYTECLIGEGFDEPSMTSLREIERAAKTAADLTRQLLQFSRLGPSGPRGVDPVVAVRNVEALLKRTIGEHIELTVDAPRELPMVALGAGQIDQILVNLVVNARDALPKGGSVAVSMCEHPLDGPKRFVLLSVADDGEGMSEDVAARAFDPFFTTKPRGQGTGLGLATVYGIVGQAGGSVEIESEAGRGTSVRVMLPVGGDATALARPPSNGAATEGKGQTVLVVDNDGAVRTLVCHMLRKHGFRAVEAASGAKAVEILAGEAGGVDVMVTDMLMPGMSGSDLAQRVCATNPDVGVIYMSGYSGEGTASMVASDGDATILEKPFTAEQLVRAVGSSLG